MLSFMKEESNIPSADNANQTQQAPAQPKTDMNSASQSQDFIAPSASDKKVKYSTYALVAVFVIGLASLFMMIKKSTPSQAQAALSEQDLKIEAAISKLVGSKTQLNTRMEELVKKIDHLSQIEQVEVEQLKRNPFKLQSLSSASTIDLDNLSGNLDDSGFKLWGIMDQGHGKSCMVNNKILKANDVIDGYKVNRIEDKFVELVSDNGSIILRIAE